MIVRSVLSFSLILMLSACAGVSEAPRFSLNEVMTQFITPSTNTLWGVEGPVNNAEWRVLSNAASEAYSAAVKTEQGGVGCSNDRCSGARASGYQSKDLDALLDVGNALYAPCEACYQLYHPGVKAES